MVSAQYLRKYLMYLHEILYTEAGQGENQNELGELDLKVMKAIQNLKK